MCICKTSLSSSHSVSMFVSFDLSANHIRISHLKNSIISQSYLTTSLLSTLLDTSDNYTLLIAYEVECVFICKAEMSWRISFLIREKPIFIVFISLFEARVDDMLQNVSSDRWKVDEQIETDICFTEYLVIILMICSYLDGETLSFLNLMRSFRPAIIRIPSQILLIYRIFLDTATQILDQLVERIIDWLWFLRGT